MSTDSPTGAGFPAQIYLIRHAEKPGDPSDADDATGPPFGVDANGNQNSHSLIPRGWQRSGALAVLFHPALGPPQAGLCPPSALLCPDYGDKTQEHRTYQTIQGLSGRLGVAITSHYAEGDEAKLAEHVIAHHAGSVVLICWEHKHIPAIATALPTVSGTVIPPSWPGDRFDVIWSFTAVPGTSPPGYAFTQIPQQLLAGDADSVI